jgi:hypothetical protein
MTAAMVCDLNDGPLPIQRVVETRLKELGMRRSEFARRCGFKNVNKAIRRIEAMFGGDLDSPSAGIILKALPTALEMGEDIVSVAIRETAALLKQKERMAAAERDAAWRTSFKPHAYLLGTATRPSSITIFGISGGAERWLKIPLDCSQLPITFATQALAVVRKTPTINFFGPTTGFIVNYTPDHAVRFDLQGNPVESFLRAYCPGPVTLTIGRSTIAAETFGQMFGAVPRDSGEGRETSHR